ncbi:MAG: helix-turn-helix domain-containing protein [Muribaculaceae bacterium]|nr:helix-turn-helix domain-containing protein [Muribaculaceae bacterium]MDE6757219.1 helix-turn-helix domain-containing protein [Muribaculaceae bacterium]
MEHLGQLLKKHIETYNLKKRDIADAVGITSNYLSTLFNRPTMDCELWEKLCIATGMNPAVGFNVPAPCNKNYSDISAQTVLGSATVTIGVEQKTLLDLLAEKERLIQVLLATTGIKIGTKSEQDE